MPYTLPATHFSPNGTAVCGATGDWNTAVAVKVTCRRCEKTAAHRKARAREIQEAVARRAQEGPPR